ncbi:hypothetical protein V5O48_014011 [Marasmius crinis-equi]|uniref:Uncharacterized protein n=1 Tax=Marasmius crinis-equi TaxID=585013 RepID=A0ABR3EYK0_9AGAR
MADTETPADLKFVSLVGKSTMLSVSSLVIEALFYGPYVLLFCASVLILCRKEGNKRARVVLLIATTIMFLMSSFQMWLDVVVALTSIKNVFVDDVGVLFAEKQAAFGKKFKLVGSVEEVIALGDALVFWRVWALCAGDRKLILAPLLFLIGTTACAFGFLGCFAQNNWPLVNPPTCNALIISEYSLSMATNLSGTIAIGYKVWFYRKNIGSYLSKCGQQARAEKILILLLESGVIYSIIWVSLEHLSSDINLDLTIWKMVQLVIVRMPLAPTFAGKVVQQGIKAAAVQLVGIYPTLLIVLIYFQRSMWDSSGNSTIVSGPKSSTSNIIQYNGSGTTFAEKSQMSAA